MQAYAIYRLPHEDHATIIRQKDGTPVELRSLSDLNGRSGFVVAPFEVKSDQPVVLIEGEKTICHLEPSTATCHLDQAKRVERSLDYARDDNGGARDDKEGGGRDDNPIIISSGYRSPEVNKAVGGAPTSNHLTGCAVDIRCAGIEQAIRYACILLDISDGTKRDYDELFIERSKQGRYWIHFAVRPKENRRKTAFVQT